MFLSVLEGSVISRINGEKKDEKKKGEYLNCYEKNMSSGICFKIVPYEEFPWWSTG